MPLSWEGNNPTGHPQTRGYTDVVCTGNRTLLGLEKEGRPATCGTTDQFRRRCAKNEKLVADGRDTTDVRYRGKGNSERQKVGWWQPGERKGEQLVFHGHRVSV